MIKFSQEKVLLPHKRITEETGGDPNVRDTALLNSALESAFATFDGNKRIGMCVLLTFLKTNGIRLRPTNKEVARVGLAVASGEMKYQDLLDCILENE